MNSIIRKRFDAIEALLFENPVINVSEFLQPIEMVDIYWRYCKFDQGIME